MTWEGADEPVVVNTFTIPELAVALGKSELTIRRWLDQDKIPGPYLRETTRNIRVYSVGEVDVMRAVLARYASDFTYLTATNHQAVAAMQEHMHAYRAHNI